jgi:hypothetical protein
MSHARRWHCAHGNSGRAISGLFRFLTHAANPRRKKLWFDTMKELNFHHDDPDPGGATSIVFWTIAAILAGIDVVLFFLRT